MVVIQLETALSRTALSRTAQRRTQHCLGQRREVHSTVPDSTEKKTELSRTAQEEHSTVPDSAEKNTALSWTAQRRTQHCPGQRGEEHSTVRLNQHCPGQSSAWNFRSF